MSKFEKLRHKYEPRLKELEQEVLYCSLVLRKLKQTRKTIEYRKEKLIDYVQTDNHLRWQFDMSEFPFRKIKLQIEKRKVLLHAQRRHQDQSMEILRTFYLPDHADSDLSARLDIKGVLTIQAPLRTNFF